MLAIGPLAKLAERRELEHKRAVRSIDRLVGGSG
jgi:hypothetical protein